MLNQNWASKGNIVVRIGIALVLLWFGAQQVMDAAAWAGLIPPFVTSMSGLSAITFVKLNGIFEIIFGLLLLVGLFTRLAAILISLHLFSIMFTVGYNDIGVRDFGLAMSALAVFLNGSDDWSLDKFWQKNQPLS